jgi:hypothetical protein
MALKSAGGRADTSPHGGPHTLRVRCRGRPSSLQLSTTMHLPRHFRRPARRTAGSRRLVRSTVAALLVLTAACADTAPTAPAAPAESRLAPAAPARSSGTTPKVETFVYDGRAQTQSFGSGHSVRFDANSVCDPQTSAYGPGTWDLPCTPASGPITFTVTSWQGTDGHTKVSFSPDVRFVPGTTQILYLNDEIPGLAKKVTVVWCSPLVLNQCVDESLTDPTLSAWISGGHVARRIKHFSGYNVVFGRADGTEVTGDAY